MKARIWAMFFLLILLGLPLGMYWYFFYNDVAQIEIFFGEGITGTVELKGTLGLSSFPLADEFLKYKNTCTTSCKFSPIIPARYTGTISSEGKKTIDFSFYIQTGEHIKQELQFSKQIVIQEKILHFPTEDELSLLFDDVRNLFGKQFTLIGVDSRNNTWVKKETNNSTQIGLLRNNSFFSVKPFSIIFPQVALDKYHNTLILHLQASRVLLFDTVTLQVLDADVPAKVLGAYLHENVWHITTESGGYDYVADTETWVQNARFTDWIDIDPKWRLGYISEKDTEKRLISNIPAEKMHGVILLLDRTTGEIRIVQYTNNFESMFVQKNEVILALGSRYFIQLTDW